MTPKDLIKMVHETYSTCKSYKDNAACSLTVALPEIQSMDELVTKLGTIKHEYRHDKMFDMRWEWMPGDCAELSYAPGTFSVSLTDTKDEIDILATESLKANLLHGILTMETEEDIFLIQRLIFFGEAEFWQEEFYEWTLGEVEKLGTKMHHLKRVNKHPGDSDIEMFVDPKTFTLVGYESNSRKLFEDMLEGSEKDRKEAHETLFGDEPGPAAVIQKYVFQDVKIVN
jgi:hypothetical protein